jgi:cyclic pyranopterin monophosphate synthase
VAPVTINIVSAQSGTGKTTILEKLLPELTGRGLKVAALKGEIHHYNLDLPGKDTWRFAQAGAAAAGMTTPEKFILIGTDRERGGMAAALQMMQGLDLVLVEGHKKSGNPKIEVVRGAVNQKPLLPDRVIAVITDVADLSVPVPVFHLEDTQGLAAFIYERFFTGRSAGEPGTWTHFDPAGRPRMVDVSGKEQTRREAYAKGEIRMNPETLSRIKEGRLSKGDVLSVAQVAAVMAVKETGRLIPMAHPLGISGVEVDFNLIEENESKVEIGVRVKLTGQTGVEMEALTGVSIAALTIYDMCKAVDKSMVIQNIRLMEKKGGRSGHYRREE